MQKQPKVSVIMSTFNRSEHFLPRAIKSVLSQSLADFELLVVDDCSTDGTEGVVRAFNDPRVVYLKLEKNSGSDTKPKNTGIMASKGEYLAFLDDDCEFLPYHLEKLAEKLDKNTNLDMVYCDMWLYDETRPDWEGKQGITFDFDAQFLLNRNYIDTSEVMIRRDLAFAVGGFDETLPKFIDWNMWVRIMKWGANIQRVPIIATNYYMHESTKSNRVKTESWVDPQTGMTMFKPTFSPSGCPIYLPYLGNDRKAETDPIVAIFTITYDRLEYTKRTWESLNKSTKYPFAWCVFDNGSSDGTQDWITKQTPFTSGSTTNKGITFASNHLIDLIQEKIKPQIIIKVDNDCDFMTQGWLEQIVDLWKRNHLLYMSPYPEGLIHNPGGGARIGYSFIGPYFVEVAYHVGGLCAAIDARAYKDFRWSDLFLHGNQDREASVAFSKQRYMPMYLPMHRVRHMDGTEAQQSKYPEYFERRKVEKTTQVR